MQNPTRALLLAEPHVTEAYLKAHIEKWQDEKGVVVGALINRIAENMPAPKSDKRDYTGGKYADWINR